jgi:PAS domain S-box-containing protein
MTGERRTLFGVVLPAAVSIALLAAGVFGWAVPSFRANLMSHRRELIREMANSAGAILVGLEGRVQSGQMSRAEAQSLAADQIRRLRYGSSHQSYFWINDMQCRMVMHPYRLDMEGKDLTSYVDTTGKPVFAEFVRTARDEGEGFVEYHWQWHDDVERMEPKVSYVIGFEPWGWVVGTGLYIADIEREIADVTHRLAWISLGIVGSVCALVALVARGGVRAERTRRRAENSLRESEAKYRILVENASDAISLVVDNRFALANPAMQNMLGYSADELRELSLETIFAESPGDGERVMAHCRDLSTGRDASASLEARAVARDGRILDLLLSGASVSVDGHDGIILIARNITVWKQAEKALRESEERFRNLAESTSDWIWETDAEGRYTYCSPRVKALLGYGVKEILGRTAFDLMLPEEARRLRPIIAKAMARGEPLVGIENVGLAKDGREVVLETNGVPFYGPDGKTLLGYRGIDRDITARREADRQRRESQRVLSTLMANLPGMAYQCRNDHDWTMEFVSEGCLQLTGYPPAELMGNRKVAYGDLIHPEDRQKVWETVQGGLKAKRSFRMEYRIIAADGQEKWVWEQGQGVFSPEEELVSVEGFITDTTDRKRAEEEKTGLEDQLRQAQKMEAIGQLAGGVAHDFNNQLTVISGYCDMLLRPLPEEDPTRHMIEEVRRAGERAHRLTSQLLAFSRKQVLNPEVIDLDRVLSEMHNPLARMLGEQVELSLIVEADRGQVKLDRSQFEQAIMNLAINARDAMPDGGVLTIETALLQLDAAEARRRPGLSPGPHELLVVRDTGEGIDDQIVEKIFEPFFTTKETGKGTGLGLAMVYGFVKQSSGAIEVESAPGNGATFRLYFPAEAFIPTNEAKDEPDDSNGGDETILVAEDEESVRQLIVRGLRRYGYTVLETSNAREALPLGEGYEGSIDLLVTDVIMPGMSGPELAKRVQQVRSSIPVLFVSGYAPTTMADHELLRPGKNLLAKPFTPRELAEAVRRVLDARTE